MTHYLDLFFLINLIFDFLLLWLTARFRRLQVSYLRLIVAAAIGSAYVLAVFLSPASGWLTSLAIKAMVACLLVWVAFGFSGLRQLLLNLLVFYLLSAAIAGVLYSVFDGVATIHLLGLFLGFAACIALLFWAERVARARRRVASWVVPIQVVIDEVCLRCSGLIDSGNHLSEPLSGTAVNLMSRAEWHPWLPVGWPERNEADFRWNHRLVLVPIRTVGQERAQLIPAIRVDRLVIELDGKRLVSEKALVAITDTTLSRIGDYKAIIHPAYTEHSSRSEEVG